MDNQIKKYTFKTDNGNEIPVSVSIPNEAKNRQDKINRIYDILKHKLQFNLKCDILADSVLSANF